MQANSPVPLEPQSKSLHAFLSDLFQALDREGLRPCILRNYEGFPDVNLGNDIDFFIRPSELARAMRALGSLDGIRIVGYSERHYVACVFLEGVSPAPGIRTLHIDFNLSLSWKGLPYLTTEIVLRTVIERQAGDLNFFVPCPVHQAILSLLASLLVAGSLKEKYFPQVQQTFANGSPEAIDALRPQFGLKAATRVVNSVIDGDRRKVLNCIRPLRNSLALRSLVREPIRSTLAVVRHYTREFAIRFSPRTLETVCILGVESDRKAAVIEALKPMLQSAAVWMESDPSGLRLPLVGRSRGTVPSGETSAQEPAGWLTSMSHMVLWLIEDWLDQFIGRTNLTLRISGSSFADLLIDPKKHRYGGPMGFARLVGKLFPSPDLWILLDRAAEGSQASREALFAEAARRLEAYRSFVKTRKSYVILDASGSASTVTESAYAAIIETLTERVDRKLRNRFGSRRS
jgi:hypothetical protein